MRSGPSSLSHDAGLKTSATRSKVGIFSQFSANEELDITTQTWEKYVVDFKCFFFFTLFYIPAFLVLLHLFCFYLRNANIFI